MILAAWRLPLPLDSIPRESGDDPDAADQLGCVPLVFPARAGMIPLPTLCRLSHGGIPRESGDDPWQCTPKALPVWYSPRERG